ncbi:hypothetical protein SAMN04487898_109127 [Pedobacter sp. ok626]|uniref:hypothetical protein n=1 Tax=Pedobacter sp. ok626 TaxID=1761882 RepID=UPI000890FC90|nr:hypothetical protein [Pedobacter sp. ok626]SDK55807.1 hypothetical protein SAMN04487898_109127 [Pedobacter sp. ok626]
MRYFLTVTSICLFSFFGCNQVNKSIQETLHPLDTTTRKIINKGIERPDIKKIIDSQITMVNSMIQTHTNQHIEVHLDGESKKFLSDRRGLEKAEEELRQLPQYAGKEIFIYQSIHFYDDGSINVMLQHPANPMYVDQYSYKEGEWLAPVPVQLSARAEAANRMVPLDSISFITAFKVAKNYNQKVNEVEGAKPINSVYASIWDKRIRWFPATINGSRERYSIEFNSDGSLKRFSVQ